MKVDLLYIFSFIALCFISCWECKPDKYGENLELVVPITTTPAKDTFAVGDTLMIEAHFDKDIEVYNTAYTIALDSFDFRTFFSISEISDSVENFDFDVEVIVDVGLLDYMPGYSGYPVSYVEDDDGYQFKYKVIFKSKGMYWIGFSSAYFPYERGSYQHPALYACKNNKRDQVAVYFDNPSTTYEAYSSIFLKTKVNYLHQLVDFDRYQKAGSISIIVQ